MFLRSKSRVAWPAPRTAPRAGAGLAACTLLAATSLLAPLAAHAGAQQYEPMSAAVRTALAAAVAEDRSPPEPRFATLHEKIDWLAQMSDKVPRRHAPDFRNRLDFIKTVRYEAQRAGLDPQLVLGLIQVESGFRKYAVSPVGARGYMQIMPFWTRVIGDGDAAKLFEMRANLRFGCTILRHYLDIEKGDLFRALGRYNGSLGRAEYPNAVMAAARRWTYAATPAPAEAPTRLVAHPPASGDPVQASVQSSVRGAASQVTQLASR